MKRIEAASLGLLTVIQAAELREITPTTMRNWIAWEVLPVVVVPGEREYYLLRAADVRAATAPTRGRPVQVAKRRGNGEAKLSPPAA